MLTFQWDVIVEVGVDLMSQIGPGHLQKIKRVKYWTKNSAPYISGDVFADNSDVSLFSPRFRGKNPSSRKVSNAQVIFCNGDKVEEFFSEYGKRVNARVLILGNSDRDYSTFEYKIPDSIKVIFAQNLMFDDARFKCLPIGLENIRLAWNGFPELHKWNLQNEWKTNEMLIGPFRQTHVERLELNSFEKLRGPWRYLNARLHPQEYSSIASAFRFVAAPRGNGMDTHRFWETIYRGSIPIVKKSLWSKNLEYLDIPYLEINEWNPEEVVNAINEYPALEKSAQEIQDLWWPAWKKRISSYL